jgi:hypothetical protein
MAMILYRVEGPGADEEYSALVDEARMLELVKARAPKETEGTLRIKRFAFRLDPREPQTDCTKAIRQTWQDVILRFPDCGSLGLFVCKTLQHGRPGSGKGNAWDIAPPKDVMNAGAARIHGWLDDAAKWIRVEAMGGKMPVSEVIWLDHIATKAKGWTVRAYSGVFHATHIHVSGDPLLNEGPCG